MTISAKVITDSVNPDGERLTTLVLEYPRFIHSEFMTHRVFSRNAASSRAVPTKTMIQRVLDDPAMPIEWGHNNPGMQSKKLMNRTDAEAAKMLWHTARNKVIDIVNIMEDLKPHKQIINRMLEPWLHMQTIVSATDWDNFFTLRMHSDAQPEFQVLATEISEAMSASCPADLQWGDWHIPFIKEEESVQLEDKLKISTARCARVSYYLHDGKETNIEKDKELHDRLVAAEPRHSSPCEHQAVATKGRHSNFQGWKQYRAFLENEVPMCKHSR